MKKRKRVTEMGGEITETESLLKRERERRRGGRGEERGERKREIERSE